MPNRKSCLIALLAFGLVLFVAGCKKPEVETVPEAPAPEPEPYRPSVIKGGKVTEQEPANK